LPPEKHYNAFGSAKSDRISAAGKHIRIGSFPIQEAIFIHKAPLLQKKGEKVLCLTWKKCVGSASSSSKNLKPQFTIPIEEDRPDKINRRLRSSLFYQ
jgi:hypothetical protein